MQGSMKSTGKDTVTERPTVGIPTPGNGRRVFFVAAIALLTAAGLTFAADEGPLFLRNLSDTPQLHTEHASITPMHLYVPAQDTQGEPPETDSGELEYYVGDCTWQDTSACELVYTRPEAKPLVAAWLDGEVELIDGLAFNGHGKRDVFVGLSLDDGATWKRSNVSETGALGSFRLADHTRYPGDVFDAAVAIEGNRMLVAWASRYCSDGEPLFAWTDERKAELLTDYPELDNVIPVDGGTDEDGYQLYLDDLFTVAGDQLSSDYGDEGYPEIGEVPYACLWVARATLEQDLDDQGSPLENSNGDPVYDLTWRAAERVTSGRRDVNRVQVASAPGAGFIVLWQEDPDGLRPGKGECVECSDGGFNGAIAHEKTDIWFTYLDESHFTDVCIDDPTDDTDYCTPGTLADFTASDLFGQKPKAAVPLAMPVRLTDNADCKGVQTFDTNGDLLDPYCYADFDGSGSADLCASTESWTNPGGTTLEICVTEDGRYLTGRTATTRARAVIKSYDSDDDGAPDSAWVALGSEKTKALGTVGDNGCDPTTDPECTVFDIGKNVWYHTFEFDKPALATQGLILNGPAVSPGTGEFFETYTDEWGNEIYDTEITRNFNPLVNSPAAAMASESKTMGLLTYKQGILFQGGPADIFTRRIVLPDTFDPAVDNPFAYANVECVSLDDAGVATPVDRLYPEGMNPNYVLGLCPVDGMNVSATALARCDDGSSGEACADLFPYNSTYEEWFKDDSQIQIPKVLEWSQTVDTVNDHSWENPYDVSRGQEGFIDGDFVMLFYATAANWNATTIGNEAYQLYARRSFDGGQTWTTLPADYTHWSALNPDVTITADGTTTCEWYGGYGEDDYDVCTPYGVGEFEPARNLTRLVGTKTTTLESAHVPTGGALKRDYTSLYCYDKPTAEGEGDWVNCGYTGAPYPEDVRDPSAFFVVFGTGDNTVMDEDTLATPQDLFYSRASNFGDDYDEQDICAPGNTEDSWYPSANVVCDEGETEFRFDWLMHGKGLSTQDVTLASDPLGERLYGTWSQLGMTKRRSDKESGDDAWFRRVYYNLLGEEEYPKVPRKSGG